jgi:PST family polysaccharide transporter/lipopolysaccharide exporter
LSLDRLLAFIRRTLVPGGGVKERAVKSGIWVTLINVFDRGLQFAKIIILARLLSPTDIGLLGIALLALAVLEQFSEFGIDRALIQRKGENVDEYLNTAWTIEIARSALVVGAAFVAAPYIAVFFNEPRSADLIIAIAFAAELFRLRNPGVVYFRKNLDFHKQFAYTLAGSVVNAGVTIGTAFVFRSVWAFVFGRVAGNVVMVVLSYAIHQYRPWPEFDRARAGELLDYGKWILGSSIVLFLINQGDDAFLGWFLTASALGIYQLAYRVSNAPATEITNVISNVVFPAYSRIQSDATRLRNGYFRTIQLTTLISFPLAAGIVVTAPAFVRGFLGEQWLPMIEPMQILAIGGAIRSLDASTGPLLDAVGRPDYNTKLQIPRLALIAVFIYPATDMWGVSGTALVIVGSGIVLSPVISYVAVRQIEGALSQFVRLLSYPIFGSAVMVFGLSLVRANVAIGSSVLEFFALTFVGVAIYVSVMAVIEWRFDIGIEAIVRSVISAVK